MQHRHPFREFLAANIFGPLLFVLLLSDEGRRLMPVFWWWTALTVLAVTYVWCISSFCAESVAQAYAARKRPQSPIFVPDGSRSTSKNFKSLKAVTSLAVPLALCVGVSSYVTYMITSETGKTVGTSDTGEPPKVQEQEEELSENQQRIRTAIKKASEEYDLTWKGAAEKSMRQCRHDLDGYIRKFRNRELSIAEFNGAMIYSYSRISELLETMPKDFHQRFQLEHNLQSRLDQIPLPPDIDPGAEAEAYYKEAANYIDLLDKFIEEMSGTFN